MSCTILSAETYGFGLGCCLGQTSKYLESVPMKPLDRLELLNNICDQFESEWRSGRMSDVASFERWYQRELSEYSSRLQSQTNENERKELAETRFGKQILFELLMLDLHYRQEQPIESLTEQYTDVFGSRAAIVEAAIRQFVQSDA